MCYVVVKDEQQHLLCALDSGFTYFVIFSSANVHSAMMIYNKEFWNKNFTITTYNYNTKANESCLFRNIDGSLYATIQSISQYQINYGNHITVYKQYLT